MILGFGSVCEPPICEIDISTYADADADVGRTPGAEWEGMHRIPYFRSFVRSSFPRSAAIGVAGQCCRRVR